MPPKGPQRINRIDDLDDLQEIYFRSGIKWFPERLFMTDAQMHKAWHQHRSRLIAQWRQERGPHFVSFAEQEFDGAQDDQDEQD